MTVWCLSMLAALLAVAGVEKVADPAPLGRALGRLLPLPSHLATLAARLLAWVEITVGMLLLFAFTRRLAILAAMALALLFAAAGAVARVRRLRVDCGCFGPLLGKAPPLGMANIAIAALILAVGSVALVQPDLSQGQEEMVQLVSLTLVLSATSTGAALRVSRLVRM
jgi:uncharacterized membrane protein YphA (DoxX/SURF4 family)